MAQILQSKGRRNEQGGTVYFADYALTGGESGVTIVEADTPGIFQSVEISDAEGGIKKARVTTISVPFSVGSPSATGTGNTVELIAGSRTEPIETFVSTDSNYNFAALSPEALKEVRDAVADVGNGKITPPAFGAKARLYQYLIKGVTSYLAPSVTLRYIYTTSSVPNLVNIMKTVRSPTNAPSLPAGGNWLFANLSYQVVYDGGNVRYRVTEEYLASGRGGWDSNLYPEVPFI